jgi:hypothetical protein
MNSLLSFIFVLYSMGPDWCRIIKYSYKTVPPPTWVLTGIFLLLLLYLDWTSNYIINDTIHPITRYEGAEREQKHSSTLSLTLALIREALNLYISFSCWFRFVSVPLYRIWSLFRRPFTLPFDAWRIVQGPVNNIWRYNLYWAIITLLLSPLSSLLII